MKNDKTWFEVSRRYMRLTQYKLAEKLGITDRQIRKYESQRAEIPQKIKLAMNALMIEFMAREETADEVS